MSFRLIPVVWKHAHVSGSAKCLLLALTDYADDNGTRIYPSYRTLAYQTGLSPSYIRKLIKRLITEGYLERVRMGGYCNGRNYSNEYRLSPRWLASVGVRPHKSAAGDPAAPAHPPPRTKPAPSPAPPASTPSAAPASAPEASSPAVDASQTPARHDASAAGDVEEGGETGTPPTDRPRARAETPGPSTQEHPGCPYGDRGGVHRGPARVSPHGQTGCPPAGAKPTHRSNPRSVPGSGPGNLAAAANVEGSLEIARAPVGAEAAAAAADAGSPLVSEKAETVVDDASTQAEKRATPARPVAGRQTEKAPTAGEVREIEMLYTRYVGRRLYRDDRFRLAALQTLAARETIEHAFELVQERLEREERISDAIAYTRRIVVDLAKKKARAAQHAAPPPPAGPAARAATGTKGTEGVEQRGDPYAYDPAVVGYVQYREEEDDECRLTPETWRKALAAPKRGLF